MQKPSLDDCYICLDGIDLNYDKCAVFMHRCRHHVCFSCIGEIRKIKLVFLCGICRAPPSRFMADAGVWSQIKHSPTQSIFIPSESTKFIDINRDYIQFLLAHSSKN